jgi:Protein of unknown function (DUF2934)
MWFAEEINSFLSLGICKEYLNMARAKSISGGKANRTNTNTNTNTNNEQTGTGNPSTLPDVKAAAAETAPAAITPEPNIAPLPRKFEVRKTEVRKNVIPIKLEDEIRRRAYELYQQRGSASGSEAQDWLTAEREVRQRYHQQQSA